VTEIENPAGKGRPTPKRKDAQARRTGPVAPPPASRKEAARQLRAKQAEGRRNLRAANLGGDDKHLLPRDQGPVRRTVRDIVDSRRNLGILLLPVALATFLSNLTGNVAVQQVVVGVWIATIFGVVMDSFLLSGLIRRTLREKFPQEEKLRGHIFYGMMRTTVLRRLRMPRPQVSRGRR
jgi:hypothetical protein